MKFTTQFFWEGERVRAAQWTVSKRIVELLRDKL